MEVPSAMKREFNTRRRHEFSLKMRATRLQLYPIGWRQVLRHRLRRCKGSHGTEMPMQA